MAKKNSNNTKKENVKMEKTAIENGTPVESNDCVPMELDENALEYVKNDVREAKKLMLKMKLAKAMETAKPFAKRSAQVLIFVATAAVTGFVVCKIASYGAKVDDDYVEVESNEPVDFKTVDDVSVDSSDLKV